MKHESGSSTVEDRAASRQVRSFRTIRFRLTLLYAGVFLFCGAVMLGAIFFVVRQSLIKEESTSNPRVTDRYGYTDQQVRFFTELRIPPPPNYNERTKDTKTIGDII